MPINPLIPLAGKSFEPRQQIHLQNQLLEQTMAGRVKSVGLANQTAESNLKTAGQQQELNEFKLERAELGDIIDKGFMVEALVKSGDTRTAAAMAAMHPQGEHLAGLIQAVEADPENPEKQLALQDAFQSIHELDDHINNRDQDLPGSIQNYQQFAALGDGSTPERTRPRNQDGSLGFSQSQQDYIVSKRNTYGTADAGGVPVRTDQLNSTVSPFRNVPGPGQVQQGQPGQAQPAQQQTVPGPEEQASQPNPDGTYGPQYVPPELPQPTSLRRPDENGVLGPEDIAFNEAAIQGAKTRAELSSSTANIEPEANAKRRAALRDNAHHDIGMARYKETLANQALVALDRAIANVEENPFMSTGMAANYFLPKIVAGAETGRGRAVPFDLQAPALDLEADLNTILGVVAFRSLNEMRSVSPTGGALGQVSNFEIALLKAQVESVNQSSSEESVKARLQGIKTHFQLVRDIVEIENAGALAIMNGADPDLTQQAQFNKIRDVYKAIGRNGGEFVDGIYHGVPDSERMTTRPGSDNRGKQEVLDLETGFEGLTDEELMNGG